MLDFGAGAYPVFYDIDGDGLTDLLVGNYGYYDTSYLDEYLILHTEQTGKIALLKNTGTLTQPAFTLTERDFAGVSALELKGVMPAFGDLDGDQTEPQKTHIMLHHWWGDVDRLSGVVHNSTLARSELEAIPLELGLTRVLSTVQADMDADPFNPENASYLEKAIQSCMSRAEGHPDLIARGELLRERLKRVGYAGASAVLAVGVKAHEPFRQKP
jgi:hypothetical protein